MELKIEKPGVLLEWEFRSEPKGIAFGMFYRQKDGSLRSEVSGGGGGGCSVWLGDEAYGWVVRRMVGLYHFVPMCSACYTHTHTHTHTHTTVLISCLPLSLSLCVPYH